MQYSSKQVTGRKVGWKEKGRKKDKNRKKRQTRQKRTGICHTQHHFHGILSYGYISIYLYWFTDVLAAFMKFDFCLTLSVCFCILHVSQSHNQEKIIFINTWLINVWSWNSDDVWIFHSNSQPIKQSHKYHAWLIFSHIVALWNYKNHFQMYLKVLVKLIRDHFLSSRDAGQLLN